MKENEMLEREREREGARINQTRRRHDLQCNRGKQFCRDFFPLSTGFVYNWNWCVKTNYNHDGAHRDMSQLVWQHKWNRINQIATQRWTGMMAWNDRRVTAIHTHTNGINKYVACSSEKKWCQAIETKTNVKSTGSIMNKVCRCWRQSFFYRALDIAHMCLWLVSSECY